MQIHKSILIITIIFACLLSFYNTLSADFVWDDAILVLNNDYMKSFRFLPLFFTNDIWKIGAESFHSGYYRPILAASFMLDYTLWHQNPFGFHLTNLILHTLASILVFLFIEKISGLRTISFFSALLFGVHPLHTETAAFISGRVDIIPLIFSLLSLILFFDTSAALSINLKRVERVDYISGVIKNTRYIFSLLFFFLALLTKEVAVTIPILAVLLDYFFIHKGKIKSLAKNFLRLYFGFFIALALYIILRSYFVGWSFIKNAAYSYSNFFPAASLTSRFFTAFKIISLYTRLLFSPFNLKVDYYFAPAKSLFEVDVILGAIVSLLAIGTAIKNRSKNPLLSFAICWWIVTIFPLINVIPSGGIFAERHMYIPSVGFCAAIGCLFLWLSQLHASTSILSWKKSVYCIFFLLVVLGIRLTFLRNKVWADDFSLWFDASRKEPQSPKAHTNLAIEYYKLNFLNAAKEEINRALQLYPKYYEAFIMLGKIYEREGSYQEAMDTYKAAAFLRPEAAIAYNSLAVLYGRQGKFRESIAAARRALKNNPYYNQARYNLALSLNMAGFIEEAIKVYEEYLKVSPDYPQALLDLGRLYYKKGDGLKAKSFLLRAIKISPDFKPAQDALSSLKN